MNEDVVGRIVRETWEEWSEYETSSLEVVLRILRAFHFIDHVLVQGETSHGLNPGEFGVLIELRLAGSPYRMTPTQLYNRSLVTSGGMTGRIDRLERRGLVCRSPDPDDRRSVLVELTDSGYELIEAAAPTHFGNMERLAEGLTSEDRECLAFLLKKLLSHIESLPGQ